MTPYPTHEFPKFVEYNGYFIDTRSGVISSSTKFYDWELLKNFIGQDVYWHSRGFQDNDDLPLGHRAYVVKVEGPDTDWIEQQSTKIAAPIFIINGIINDYGAVAHLSNVTWLPWIEWHYQIRSMLRDYSPSVHKNIKKKISCLSRMVRLNRMIAMAAVKTYFGTDAMISWHGCCYRPGDALQSQTGHAEFDQWLARYYDMSITTLHIDDFQMQYDVALRHDQDLFQRHTHDFHFDAYQQCAINVTNESFYTSGQRLHGIDITRPGPFLTEKTLKCLLGETAFIANGNFQTYHTLETLGFKFDYKLDLGYDQISSDLNRLCSMTDVLKTISDIDTMDLFQCTRSSCLANKEHIMSGKFFNICENINEQTVQQILTNIS